MKNLILVLLMLSGLGACGTTIEYVELERAIPPELLEPTPISEREPITYRA